MRIDDSLSASALLRSRAVYFVGGFTALSQVVNLCFLTYSYQRWTLDHTIALVAGLILLIVPCLLRYTKNFTFFALFFSNLLLLSIAMATIPDKTGINSAMLPLLVSGVMICAVITSWRSVVVYTIAAVCLVWVLYYVSASAPVPYGVPLEFYEMRNFQRAVQATIGFVIGSFIMGLFTINLDNIFTLLEKNIELAKTADRTKSSFLANMSHELRTPLNGVIGMAELLSRTELTSQQRQYTDIINGCSAGLVTIINDVLDLSKLDAGKTVIKFEPFHLYDMVSSLALLHRPAAVGQELILNVQYVEGTPQRFIGDESRLRQVVNNLIGNALKFTPKHGRIDVTVKGRDMKNDMYELFIFVKDTGVGISLEDQARIFNRFEQVDNQRNATVTGTGLGLSITKGLIDAMGGRITLDSKPNQGTLFTISVMLKIDKSVEVPDVLDIRRSA